MSKYRVNVHAQYIKDLSFESPNSPFLLIKKDPSIGVIINISSLKLEIAKETSNNNKKKSFYEITLHIQVTADIKNENKKDNVAFICEIKYCGILSIEDFMELSTEEIRQALFVSGPTILFPFVREIIARITSSGGFPPLMLDPVDFKAMYKQQTQ